jgi:hypothetical protein
MPQGLKDLLLGEMALRHRLLTEEQLDLCTQQQIDERYQRPLGQIMIEKGFLQPDVLEALLRTQRRAIEEFEKNAEFGQLFGKTAVLKGFITAEQLAQAVRAQARKHARGVRSRNSGKSSTSRATSPAGTAASGSTSRFSGAPRSSAPPARPRPSK